MFLLFASILLYHSSPPLLFALRTSSPVFSANLRQTLFIHFQSSSAEENNSQGGHAAGGISIGKRASEPSNGGRRNNRKANHHRHHNHNECERLSERQKYARLESVGGRNQQFMANSAREASHNFPSLLPRVLEEDEGDTHSVEMFLRQNDDPSREEEMMAIMGGRCDRRCREIRIKLERALVEKAAEWAGGGDDWTERMMMDDAVDGLVSSPEAVGLAIGSAAEMGRRGCRLERFVPIGNCTEHGFEEAQGNEKLCTACQGIFMLNRNCFPLFVNAVVCGRHELLECIYDRMSGSAQGKCRPKMLGFKVMFNRGTVDCERWSFEYLEVPVACECYLSKRSVWLEAAPPPGAIGTEEH